MRKGRRIAVDVGDVRIGVAVSDPDGLLATPVETVAAGAGETAEQIAQALPAEKDAAAKLAAEKTAAENDPNVKPASATLDPEQKPASEVKPAAATESAEGK